MQILFSNGRAETKNEDTNNTRVHCHCHWPWEDKIYLHRFKLTDNPMYLCNEREQSPEHLIYECKILEFQRSSLKQHITAGGGAWPTTNSDLVAKYLNPFSQFVKSIDFNKLQWTIQ